METSLERIQGKISELEAQISDLRITARELLALEKGTPRPTRAPQAATSASVKAGPVAKAKPRPAAQQKTAIAQPKTEETAGKPETVSAAVAQALAGHDPVSVGEIAEIISATGREINNRAISFTLQALKKRGIAKSVDGKWTTTAPRSRAKKAQSAPKAHTEPVEA